MENKIKRSWQPKKTPIQKEILAGITGFFAISYIIIVNPIILTDAGIPANLSVFATILNTQGGPRRNEKAQILKPDNSVIPNLYGAGEAGSITTNQYQAGQDVAELLIFGKIAGENVAKEKENIVDINEIKTDIISSDEKTINYDLKDNQYIGQSNQGMGNELVVKVTVKPNSNEIQKIDVVKQSETKEIGEKIIKPLLNNIVKANSTDVDAISGASLTSNAVKEAVNNAISKIK